jgi:hypothetical protein
LSSAAFQVVSILAIASVRVILPEADALSG